MPDSRSFSRFVVLAGAVVLLPFFLLTQSSAEKLEQHQYEGNLGQTRIGMTIIREGNRIEGGHYFYQKFLQDIALTGSFENSEVVLKEEGGSFHLHFVGNGSEKNQPLDFNNSIGMDGNWVSSDGKRNYPVALQGTTIRSAAQTSRYADVTTESDTAFEKRVQSLFRAVLNGDKPEAVKFISYPLSANLPGGKRLKLKTPAEVIAAWDQLFTPAMMLAWKKDLPHDMFVHDGMAMLGNGEAWFDAKGLSALNVLPPAKGKQTSQPK